MRQLQLEECKSICLEILQSLHNFCENNGITYFLDSGTLIGCIRHEGFIPWDDDIDIIMPRDDYEKFISTYDEDGFTLYHFKKQTDYFYQFAKISKDGTIINEIDLPDIKDLGVNIDIFVMDGMPNNLLLRRFHQDFLLFFQKYRALMTKAGQAIPSLSFLFRWRWVDYFVNFIASRYSPQMTKYCGNIIATSIRHKEIPTKCFEKSVMMPFEGCNFRVPIGYDEYLTRMYGNYMTLPPKDKRVSNHNYEAFALFE